MTLLWDVQEGERSRAHRRAHAITVHSSVRDVPAVWVENAQQHAGTTVGRLAAEDDRGSGVAVPTLPAVVCRYWRRCGSLASRSRLGRHHHASLACRHASLGVTSTALDHALGLRMSASNNQTTRLARCTRSLASSGVLPADDRHFWGRGGDRGGHINKGLQSSHFYRASSPWIRNEPSCMYAPSLQFGQSWHQSPAPAGGAPPYGVA